MRDKKLVIVDLFCGAGGFSSAAVRAVKKLDGELERFIAVNHWDYAIATHSKNHKFATHYCESVDAVNPREVVPGRRVHLLLASPECTHHSNARGGTPVNDQSRVTAWHVLKWLQELYVDAVVIENVREFMDWGPLGANGRPLKSKKGKTFMAYIEAMKSLGYRVDWRVLRCADYGDPTSRERLFILARRDRKPLTWPEPTHTDPKKKATNQISFLNTSKLRPWRTAREIIDWTIQGKSIFNRKKPLSPNTMRRIMRGLVKFGLAPFTVGNGGPQGSAKPKSVDAPLNTVLAENRLGLVQPFVLGQQSGASPRSVDEPLPTVAGAGAISLVQPFIVKLYGTSDAVSVDSPMPTITAESQHLGLAMPFVVNAGGPEITPRTVDEPLNTILTREHLGLVQPFLVPVSHGRNDGRAHPIDSPVPTITGVHNLGLAQPYIVPIDQSGGLGPQVRSIDEPLGTVTTQNRFGLAQPWVYIFNGTATGSDINDPVPTVTGTERLALCVPLLYPDSTTGYALLDILFRMFEPHELARAMSFPRHYHFVAPNGKPASKRHKIKMIGNAVPGETAYRLCRMQLAPILAINQGDK